MRPSENTPSSRKNVPTYAELGIITEKPKKYDYATKELRLKTFDNWPTDHRLKKEDLAESGFYYAGYGDCARCFFCGGGLRNWEDDDNVLVEHARWFPKCAFIRQQMGQGFVNTVQELNRDHDVITLAMVASNMGIGESDLRRDKIPFRKDAAVKAMLDFGYNEADIFAVLLMLRNEGVGTSADLLLSKLTPNARRRAGGDLTHRGSYVDVDVSERKKALKSQSQELRKQLQCKICWDAEVAVVFLPCGHLVTCFDCAQAMKTCPICRSNIKGCIRAFVK